MANARIRFMENNKIETGNLQVSDEDPDFPIANALNPYRTILYKSTTGNVQIDLDLGFADQVTFFSMIGPLNNLFGISPTATVTLSANNVPIFPGPLNIPVTVTDRGAKVFVDDVVDDTFFRFWRININSPDDATGISIGHIYLGDHRTVEFSNVSRGFQRVDNDRTVVTQSLSGIDWFDVRNNFDSFVGLNIGYMLADDRKKIQEMVNNLGFHTSLYISIDPTLLISTDIDEYTRYMRFTTNPVFRHHFDERYSVSFQVADVI